MIQAIRDVHLPNLDRVGSGKVRESFKLSGNRRLIVTTDRISAFDVVMQDLVPDKGRVLTRMTECWLNTLPYLFPFGTTMPSRPNPMEDPGIHHHLIHTDPRREPELKEYAAQLAGRSMIVVDADYVYPVECVVRGYLDGSGWKEYQRSGTVCGIELPAGLRQGDQLPQPLFTPSTKAEPPEHDENISYERMIDVLTGFFQQKDNAVSNAAGIARILREVSLTIYRQGAAYARERGIIIADTKFEFGVAHNGSIMLIDEVLTPDSSRFWPIESYLPGAPQPSFDKQYLRDYLQWMCDHELWNKQPPPAPIFPPVLDYTATRYQEILQRLFPEAAA